MGENNDLWEIRGKSNNLQEIRDDMDIKGM